MEDFFEIEALRPRHSQRKYLTFMSSNAITPAQKPPKGKRRKRILLPSDTTRVIAFLVVAAILSLGMLENEFERVNQYLIGFVLLYPVMTIVLARIGRHRFSQSTNVALIFADAFSLGVILVFVEFSIVPTFSFIIMSFFSSMVIGGIRVWLTNNIALILGAVFGITSFGFSQAFVHTSDLISLTTALGTGIYVSITSYFAHRQAQSLLLSQRKIQQQTDQHAALARKLSKYLPPQVWGNIFSGRKDVKLETQRKKLTVFFSDIKSFVDISEELEPEALTELLNNYFTEMSKIAHEFGGTIDKFIGDAIMIFFGDPNSRGAKEDAMACVSMAIAMRKHMKVLRQQWRAKGISAEVEIRMGINTGYCTVGNFGAASRMDYTIIGKEVNLASRLESQAKASEVLISEETYALVRDQVMCRDKEKIAVKGFSKPVSTYQVLDFRSELGADQSFIEHELDGFAMCLDVNKVRNYDKDRVLKALQIASQKVKETTVS